MRDAWIFTPVVLVHSWSTRLILNSLEENKLAPIQMNISPSKTTLHEWGREEAGGGACRGTAIREDSVTYINQLRGEKGDREEGVREKNLR